MKTELEKTTLEMLTFKQEVRKQAYKSSPRRDTEVEREEILGIWG